MHTHTHTHDHTHTVFHDLISEFVFIDLKTNPIEMTIKQVRILTTLRIFLS